MTIQRLRGTRDIYGEEAVLFERLESLSREVFGNFGFREIRTPILEEKKLFVRALGTETDVVQKEMYEFVDRSKTPVAMRPEGTAGVVRAYLENNLDKTEGLVKFYYMGPMFRSERPQAGRLRQFHQIGVEQLGTDSPYADAETIHCLTAFLDRVGISGYRVRLNNLGSFEERHRFEEALKKYLEPKSKALCDDCQSRLQKNVFRILDCKLEPCRQVIAQAPNIEGYLTPESRAHFEKVCHGLSLAGIAYEQDFYMVRGLDYYTKTVFEISHPDLGSQDALAAGGRYDSLIELFEGPKNGAVGFAIGLERLLMCLSVSQQKLDLASEPIFFMATLGDKALEYGFKLVCNLRVNGLKVLMDFSAKSLKSQMRSADKHKCRYVIILGDDELIKNKFVLKDMQTGTQEELGLDQALKSLKAKRDVSC